MATSLPPSSYFIIIAANLTVLTYNIGVLIYALPIPSRRLKRWAPLLIEDSIYAALLILLFTTIMYTSDYVASLSGATLSEIARWIEERAHGFVTEYLVRRLATIPLYMLPIGGGVISSLVMLPVSLIFYSVMTATASLLVPLYILMKLRALLAALGIAFYALPFRIGRNIGASLLAFAVVGYIVFHFLPYWMNIVQAVVEDKDKDNSYSTSLINTSMSGGESLNLYSTWGLIYDRFGGKPVYGVLVFNNKNNNYTLTYIIQKDGAFYTIDGNAPLPAGRYDVSIEYLGLKLKPVNYLVDIPGDLRLTYDYSDMPYRLDLEIHNALFLQPQVAIVTSCFINKYNIKYIDYNKINVTLDCSGIPYMSQSAIIAMPSDYILEYIKVTNLASALDIKKYNIAWRGVPAKQTVALFAPYMSLFKIIIIYKFSNNIEKPIIEKTNLRTEQYNKIINIKLSDILNLIDFITPAVVHGIAYTIAAFSFIAIMSSLVLGFARFLGAYSPRIVFQP